MADSIRLPSCAQIGQQSERLGIKQSDFVQVGDRQRKSRALQQMGAIAQFGKRRNAR
jgi:hypothetical protein